MISSFYDVIDILFAPPYPLSMLLCPSQLSSWLVPWEVLAGDHEDGKREKSVFIPLAPSCRLWSDSGRISMNKATASVGTPLPCLWFLLASSNCSLVCPVRPSGGNSFLILLVPGALTSLLFLLSLSTTL